MGVQFQTLAGALPPFRDVTFAAANFTGNGTMTWTVTALQVTVFRYAIYANRIMEVILTTNGGVVGGALNTRLQVAIPESRVVRQTSRWTAWINSFGVANEAGRVTASGGGSIIIVERLPNATNWTAGAASVGFHIRFEVT